MRQSPRVRIATQVLFTVLLVLAALLTYRRQHGPESHTRVALPATEPGRQARDYTYDRLAKPGRTVVRDTSGAIVATFTDQARTVVLAGPARTFREPKTTTATIQTQAWVRFVPRPWTAGAERAGWFRRWFPTALADRSPDMFAISMQYVTGAKEQQTRTGLRLAGDAGFGPVNPAKRPGETDYRDENSDFYDYLGRNYRFPDGKREKPDRRHHRMVDCTGFLRLVLGYRMHFPLLSDNRAGPGLPRRAWAMDQVGPGVVIVPNRHRTPTDIDGLQPGDLVFFDLDRRDGNASDHSGIYLGLDTDGHPRFVSSREEADGPTFGDVGGTARLDGNGFYTLLWRAAKRL